MNSPAFWISPDGYIIPVDRNHINTVIKYSEKFGYPVNKIKSKYTKYKEPVGLEGKARHEIIIDLVQNGWIRMRRYNQYWSITVGKLNDVNKFYICQWARRIYRKGFEPDIEKDITMPIRIFIADTGETNEEYDLEDCIKGKLKISKRIRTRLKFRKSPDELPDQKINC